MDQDGDDWEQSGPTLTRYHKNYGCDLYRPADDQAGGLDHRYVQDKRLPLKYYGEGSDFTSRTPGWTLPEASLLTGHGRGGPSSTSRRPTRRSMTTTSPSVACRGRRLRRRTLHPRSDKYVHSLTHAPKVGLRSKARGIYRK